MSSTLKYPHIFFFTILQFSSIVLAVEHVHIPCGVVGRSVVHPYYLGPITAIGNPAQPRRFCFCWPIQWLTFLTFSKGLQNFVHPRTDAVVIMIAIDETGDKVLLGRGVRQTTEKTATEFPNFIS